MPSRAKMMRKRKSRSRREQMAFMELSSELTRSDKAAQCLQIAAPERRKDDSQVIPVLLFFLFFLAFFKSRHIFDIEKNPIAHHQPKYYKIFTV